MYIATRRREAAITVAAKKESTGRRSVVIGAVVAGVVGIVALIAVVVVPHRPGPSTTVESEMVSAAHSIKTVGFYAKFPTLANAKSELASSAREFHLVSTVRNASQLSIAESPEHNQFVIVGTSNGTCLGIAMYGLSRTDTATVRNVPSAPGVTYAHWTMPTSGCSAEAVPARTVWGTSFTGAK